MTVLKLLMFHDYLYSPKNWLHKQPKVFKILIIFIKLSILPYLSFSSLFFFTLFYLSISEFIYTSTGIRHHFYKISFIFSTFALLNFQSEYQILKEENCNRIYLLICNFRANIEKDPSEKLGIFYGLPISLIRLSNISLLYVIIIKLLTFTTSQKDIIHYLFRPFYEYKKMLSQRFLFEIQVSLNFLNIILNQIKIMQVAYITRSILYKQPSNYRYSLTSLFFNLQQLIFNTYYYIYSISNTVYYNEICLKNLDIKK